MKERSQRDKNKWVNMKWDEGCQVARKGKEREREGEEGRAG